MIRNLKMLGIACVAILATSAVVASAAMAEESFTASSVPATVTGGQTTEHKFTTTAGNVTCKNAHFVGTASLTKQSDLTIKPSYSECFLTGTNIAVTVNTANGSYTFTTPAKKQGNVDVVGTIVVSGPGCSITVGAQTLGKVDYANEAAGDVLVTATVSGIHYSHSGFLCGSGTGTTGTYTGSTLVNGGAANLSVD